MTCTGMGRTTPTGLGEGALQGVRGEHGLSNRGVPREAKGRDVDDGGGGGGGGDEGVKSSYLLRDTRGILEGFAALLRFFGGPHGCCLPYTHGVCFASSVG